MSEEKEVSLVSSTKQSKIVKYKLEEDCVNLRKSGLSYSEIANELNASGQIPEDDKIDKYVVMRFLEKMPDISKQVVQSSKSRLVQVVNNNMDIVHEVSSLFAKTKNLLNMMEEEAIERGRHLDPYRFKAVSSEMRELLKQMTEIQREVNDYNNVRKFMEIILDTLREEAPEAIPSIADKLRQLRNTQWFADMMEKSGGEEK